MRMLLALLMSLAVLASTPRVLGQAPASDPDAASPPRLAWSEVREPEQRIVRQMLAAPDWPFRVFGLLRLERYQGEDVQQMVRDALDDDAWQVRCFALRQAGRLHVPVGADDLAAETEARVMRSALRHGIDLPEDLIGEGTRNLMKTEALDQLMLGLEIAAASEIDSLRDEAQGRIRRLIRRMDDSVATLVSRRLGALLGIDPAPKLAGDWRGWLESRRNQVELPPASFYRAQAAKRRTLVADLDFDGFSRLRDYLDSLRQRDLELVLVMDFTASMIPMINEARAGVDELILFLNDISGEMRLAFVAYRDHDNQPVWEGLPFTDDIDAIREFLFNLRITGGADYPEAVLDGLTACGQLEWSKAATRQIIVVGDAPPHDEDSYKLFNLLESYRNKGLTVHAVHVPMEYQPGYLRRLPANRVAEAEQWLVQYNRRTAAAFGEIARIGGGRKSTLTDADLLVPSIMRYTIEEAWWPIFDDFYELYLELCR